MSVGLQEVEEATDKAIEQENRVESQLEAFGAMFSAFQTN